MRVGPGPVPDTLIDLLAGANAGRPVLVAGADLTQWGPELTVTTSGSAGHPRAVARTWASWRDSFPPLAELAGLTSVDRVLLTGPLTATLHLFAALHTLWLGAELTDEPAAATATHAVPVVLDRLLDRCPALRRAVVAGAALPDDLAQRAADRSVAVLEYYGATELSFVAARRPPAPFRPFPQVEVAVVDGLLWARSPFLASGYVGESGFRTDPDGFATVGDQGRIGADGSIEVGGRADAAITCGGETVLAEDIEAVLSGIAGVRGAVVVGLAHTRLGQVAAALVETDRLAPIRLAARTRLSGAALPRRWLATAALPRTAAGKPDRAAARTAFARQRPVLPADPGARSAPLRRGDRSASAPPPGGYRSTP